VVTSRYLVDNESSSKGVITMNIQSIGYVKSPITEGVDGTTVLDIKPCFPPFDRKEQASAPEWVDRLMHNYF
jgi:hypothetical protein